MTYTKITPTSFKTRAVGLSILVAMLASTALSVCEGGMVVEPTRADRSANINPERIRRRAKSSKASGSSGSSDGRSASAKSSKSSSSRSGDSKSSKSEDGSRGGGEPPSGKASNSGREHSRAEDVADRLILTAVSLERVELSESIDSRSGGSGKASKSSEDSRGGGSGKASKSGGSDVSRTSDDGDRLVPAMLDMATPEPTTPVPTMAEPTTAETSAAEPTTPSAPASYPTSSPIDGTHPPSSSREPSTQPTVSFRMPSDSFVLDGTVPLDQRLPNSAHAETSSASSVLLLAPAALAWAIRP